MSKEIYNRLALLSPGFLRKDGYKYAKTNNFPVETLQSFTDAELLSLKIAQLYVLPPKVRKESYRRKRAIGKYAKKYNWSPIFRLTQPS